MSSAKNTTGRFALLGAVIALLLLAAPAAALAAPRLEVVSQSNTNAEPSAPFTYNLELVNEGDAVADGTGGDPILLRADLPSGITAESVTMFVAGLGELDINEIHVLGGLPWECAAAGGGPVAGGEEIECSFADTIRNLESPSYFSAYIGLPAVLHVHVNVGAVSGPRTTRFTISGGGSPPVGTADPTDVTSAPAAFGVDAFDTFTLAPDGSPFTQAAGHPDSLTTYIDYTTHTDSNPLHGEDFPVEPPRDVVADLPPGLVGNPSVADRCSLVQLSNATGTGSKPLCSSTAQIGTATVRLNGERGALPDSLGPVPLYSMDPAPGEPARFGFSVLGNPVVLDTKVRSDGSIAVLSPKVNEYLALAGNSVTFWGVPALPGHDRLRSCPEQGYVINGAPSCPTPVGSPQPPFFRMPTSCTAAGEGMKWSLAIDSWDHPGALNDNGEPDLSDPSWKTASIETHQGPGAPYAPSEWGEVAGVEHCGSVPFSPSLSSELTTETADSPTGLKLDLRVPQQCWQHAEEVCSSDLRDAAIKLPRGMTLNPSAATGLGACSEAQIGLGNTLPAGCPNDSKLGTVEIDSPLLSKFDSEGHVVTDTEGRAEPEPLTGAVYLAKQTNNPSHSLLAMYLVAEGSGVVIKQAGRIEADPKTGRLTTVFEDAPQLPFSDLYVELFGGPRAPLRTPPTCGSYAITAKLTPWSGNAPADVGSGFEIENCPTGGFSPTLSAGTQNPLAGATSPFNLRLTREDGEGELAGLGATLPPGLSGYLKGIPYCPDSALAQVSTELETGRLEEAHPSCPKASQIGTVTVGAGAGPTPFFTQAGRAYLAGPYKGAPLSVAVIAPAVAGPFDLGNVVVRNALQVNPETTQITAVSDPIPHILHGIALDLRDVRVELDRPDFTLNPTSCEPLAITSTITSVQGLTANPSQRFQVGGCERLPFKPKLSLRLKGRVNRTANPALIANLTARPGEANIAYTQVKLPPAAFLDNAHIGAVCTRVQFSSGAHLGEGCPADSVYGSASATTPLLEAPLQGKVYLRSNPAHKLPDLVAALNGQIEVALQGKTDSVKGALRNTFEAVPDAPVSSFHLELFGGKRGLIQMSSGFCKHSVAVVNLVGQNGKLASATPVVKSSACGSSGAKHKHHHRGHG